MHTIRHGSSNETGGATAAKRGGFGLEGKLILFLLLAVLSVLALFAVLVIREENKMAQQQAKTTSLALAKEYAAAMKARFELPLDTARALAAAIGGLREAESATRQAVDAMLAATLARTPELLALWSCWEPDAFDGKDQEFAETAGHDASGRFIPLWIRSGGAVERRVLENYDRRDSGDAYLKARERGEEILSEPFERTLGDRKILVTSLVAPILSGDKVVGAVGADLPLEALHKITKEAALYETGFGRLLTFDGIVASHKDDVRVGKPAGELQTPDGPAFLARLRAGGEIFEKAWSEALGLWALKASVPVRVGQTSTPWLFSIVLREAEVMAEAKALSHRLLLMGAGAALVIALCVWAIARRLVRPLRRVTALAERAKNGDLTVRLEDFGVTSRDELGEMAAAVAAMIAAQANTLRTLNDGADRLAAETETFAAISAAVKELAAAAEKDTDNVAFQMENLAAAAQEINASVEEVASGAQAAAQRSTEIAGEVDQAHRGGEKGAQAVLSVAQSVLRLAEESSGAAAQVRNLGARAREIQGFVGQISQIADQTNLLALNAAIEAARAGEAGRGFAVVAEEVRKLAEESNNAARRITDLAAGITKDLDGVVAAVERNAEDSRSASALAEQTNKAIEGILSALAQITQATQDLAAVSQEQAASSEEIAATVQNIALRVSDATQAAKAVRSRMDDVAEEALRVAGGAERLTAVSRALRGTLEGFRLAEESAQAAQAPAALPAGKR